MRESRHQTGRYLGAVLTAALIAGAAGLAGCAVVESQRVPGVASDPELGTSCASGLGSYALPRAYLRVEVGQAGTAKPGLVKLTADQDLPVQVVRHPDPSLAFCLHYANSYAADDKIDIIKWPVTIPQNSKEKKGAFLGAVTVNATDQSVYIINSLIRALFIALSGSPEFPGRQALLTAPPKILADLEYDPFDPVESASVNARLSKYGYCLVLEGYTFDITRVNVAQYCNHPERYGRVQTMVTKAYAHVSAEPMNPLLPGIHYRPQYPYRLITFERSDRTGRWEISRTDTVQLENMSPVMTLSVDRAAFASRSAYFLFKEGALQTACVSKTSELEGFVKIPLEVSRSIVDLPATLVKVQIDQFQGQEALAKVQQQLYLAQQAQIDAAMGKTYEPPSGTDTSVSTHKTSFDFGAPADLEAFKTAVATYPTDVLSGKLKTLCGGSS